MDEDNKIIETQDTQEIEQMDASAQIDALKKVLAETQETLEQVKNDLKESKTINHELLLRMPRNNPTDDDLFAPFSKYKNAKRR